MGFIQVTAWGAVGGNIKLLVANDKTEFEILIFGPIAK